MLDFTDYICKTFGIDDRSVQLLAQLAQLRTVKTGFDILKLYSMPEDIKLPPFKKHNTRKDYKQCSSQDG
jgi:hypothetical protein